MHIQLESLNLGFLTLSGSHGLSEFNTITKCLIQDVNGSDMGSTFSQNLITGSVSVHGHARAVDIGPVFFLSNVFTSTAIPALMVDTAPGTQMRDNAFYSPSGATAISLINCDRFRGVPTTVRNNTIGFSGPNGSGMRINSFDVGITSGISDVAILNNRIDTVGGFGVTLSTTIGGGRLTALFQGNDFHDNAAGVVINGGGQDAGTIDLGGGPLGSLGGNDFRSFTAPASAGSAAIVLQNAPNSVVSAIQNIFANNVSADSVVFAQTGLINVAGPLGPGRAFVQTLYNEVLGRTGTLAELDPWVNLLGSQGQAAVVNGISRSPEALGRGRRSVVHPIPWPCIGLDRPCWVDQLLTARRYFGGGGNVIPHVTRVRQPYQYRLRAVALFESPGPDRQFGRIGPLE
jgi:hypothetical protein